MTRILKALGVALVAAFAMSAFAVSSASAADVQDVFEVHGGSNAILTAEAEQNQVFDYTTEGDTVTCSTVTISEATVTDGATNVTVKPKYNNEEATCPTALGTNARITMNGCHYTFTGLTTEAQGFDAGVHIGCPAGQNIVIDAGLGCNIIVPSQTVYGVRYDNVLAAGTPNDVTITTTVSGIDATAPGFSCFIAGLPASSANGTYVGNVLVTGFQDVNGKEGATTGITTDVGV